MKKVSAHSARAYTATLLVRVNVMRGGVGVHPPPSPARTDFTLITECTPESRGCNSVYSVVDTAGAKLYSQTRLRKIIFRFVSRSPRVVFQSSTKIINMANCYFFKSSIGARKTPIYFSAFYIKIL